MSDERTLPASPRRRTEAWRSGSLPRSSPLTTAVVLLAVAIYGACAGGTLVSQSAHWLQARWLDSVAADAHPDQVIASVQQSLWAGVALAGGVVLTAFAAAVSVELVQTGLRLAPESLAPDAARLGAGSSRLVSGLSLWTLAGEAFRWLSPLALLATLLWNDWPQIRALATAAPIDMPATAGELTMSLAWRMGGLLLVLGLLHYAWVRTGWERRLQMTPDEHREEQRLDRRRVG